jgi:pectin methylesterase-like acyl-CoA thioesterase
LKKKYPLWKPGIYRKNIKIPNNKGRIYLYSPDQQIKRFVHLNSDTYNHLISLGYKRKNN